MKFFQDPMVVTGLLLAMIALIGFAHGVIHRRTIWPEPAAPVQDRGSQHWHATEYLFVWEFRGFVESRRCRKTGAFQIRFDAPGAVWIWIV